MSRVNIVNLRTVADIENWRNEPDNVYVGRGSDWGNPFKLNNQNSREKVVALFRDYLLNNKRNALSTKEN